MEQYDRLANKIVTVILTLGTPPPPIRRRRNGSFDPITDNALARFCQGVVFCGIICVCFPCMSLSRAMGPHQVREFPLQAILTDYLYPSGVISVPLLRRCISTKCLRLLHSIKPANITRMPPRIVKSPVPGPPVFGRDTPAILISVIVQTSPDFSGVL